MSEKTPHPVTQAADRLNAALQRLEQHVAALRQGGGAAEELNLLEQENMQLHQENQMLRDLLATLETRLEMSIMQIESLMEAQS